MNVAKQLQNFGIAKAMKAFYSAEHGVINVTDCLGC